MVHAVQLKTVELSATSKVSDRLQEATLTPDIAVVMHMIQINVLGYALFTLLDIGFRCFHAQQQIRAAIARHTIRNRRLLEPLERDALYGLESNASAPESRGV